jgi:hypothetical protein
MFCKKPSEWANSSSTPVTIKPPYCTEILFTINVTLLGCSMRLGALVCEHDAGNKSGKTRCYHSRGSADAQRFASDYPELCDSQTSSSPEDWAAHRHHDAFTRSIFAYRPSIAEAVDGGSHLKKVWAGKSARPGKEKALGQDARYTRSTTPSIRKFNPAKGWSGNRPFRQSLQ